MYQHLLRENRSSNIRKINRVYDISNNLGVKTYPISVGVLCYVYKLIYVLGDVRREHKNTIKWDFSRKFV